LATRPCTWTRTDTERTDVDRDEARERFVAERVARLATVRPDGSPHLVPVVFVAEDDRVWLIVDEKPKSSRELRRLTNVEREPRVSLLADGYDDRAWGLLWWVRADGTASVVRDPDAIARAADRFGEKYPQHRKDPPKGPAIVVDVSRWTGWTAAG
jgi:PPOX class probable F420-dependent enzyme